MQRGGKKKLFYMVNIYNRYSLPVGPRNNVGLWFQSDNIQGLIVSIAPFEGDRQPKNWVFLKIAARLSEL